MLRRQATWKGQAQQRQTSALMRLMNGDPEVGPDYIHVCSGNSDAMNQSWAQLGCRASDFRKPEIQSLSAILTRFKRRTSHHNFTSLFICQACLWSFN